MPKKLTPAQKGWQTRQRNERKRSNAAKKGWITRRANAKKPKKGYTRYQGRTIPRLPKKGIVRARYVSKSTKKAIDYDIHTKNGKVTAVTIFKGKKTYTYTGKDATAFNRLIGATKQQGLSRRKHKSNT